MGKVGKSSVTLMSSSARSSMTADCGRAKNDNGRATPSLLRQLMTVSVSNHVINS